MDQISGRTFLSFSLLDSLYWAFYAAFAGYITTYLLSCGMSSAVLSLTLAAFMGMSFIGSFFWGSRCDKAGTNRKIFIPEFAAAILVAMAIYFLAEKNYMISALLYPLFGFLSAPLGSNLDSWMLRSFNRSAAVYGRARAVGSAGYAVAMLVCGQLITVFGYMVIPAASLFFAAIVLLIAFLTREEPYENIRSRAGGSPKDLLKIRPYMYMIIILFLSGLAISPINNLKIVILESVGGDVSNLGMDAFAGVMLQACLLFISGSLRRLPPYVRLFLASLCTLITAVLTFLAVNPLMIILGTVMNNIGNGLLLPTMRQITESTVSGTLKNTAHAMCDATFGSFAGIIALLYSGSLMDAFGARSAALLGSFIMISPVIMSLVSMIIEAKKSV